MPWITKEGRTVDEARDAAIAASGRALDELDVEVVNEGAKGLFGLGGEPAVVRVRPKEEATDFRHAFQDDITPSPDAPPIPRSPIPTLADDADDEERFDDEDGDDEVPHASDANVQVASDDDSAPLSERQQEAADLGAEIVRGILERMQIEGEINTRVAGGTVYIEVFGDEMGILIGRSGATLEALQEIVRAGIQRRLKTRQAVVVDVEAYWERRRKPRGEQGERPERGGGSGERRGGDRRRGGRGRRGERGGREREVDGNR
jgi:spoIIIJ-associated protein